MQIRVTLLPVVFWIVLAQSCINPDDVDLVPDDLRRRNELLAACGESITIPVELEGDRQVALNNIWRQQYGALLGFSDTDWDRNLTLTGQTYIDDRLKIDYYYFFEWIYIRFTFQCSLVGLEDDEAISMRIRKAIKQGDYYPLPDGATGRLPMDEETARSTLDQSCEIETLRAACPEVRYISGRFYYLPIVVQNNNGQPSAAIELLSGDACCKGVSGACSSQ